MNFENCKKHLAEIIEKMVDDPGCDQRVRIRKVVEAAVERFGKIAFDETAKWSKEVKKLNVHVREMMTGNHKHFYVKDNFLYQIENLKEFALNLLCTPDRNYLIYGADPLEYLKTKPDVFVVEKKVVESLIDHIIYEIAEETFKGKTEDENLEGNLEESKKNYEDAEMIKKKEKSLKNRSADVSFLDGLCAKSCRII